MRFCTRARSPAFGVLCTLVAIGASAARADDVARQDAAPRSPTRAHSAHADRVILVPTAQTQPKGTLFLTDYEVVVPSVGYAWSDRVQTTISGTTDFSTFGFVDATLKASLVRSRHVHLSAAASLDYAAGEDEDLPFGRATLIGQLCVDAGCRSSLSLAASLIAHDAPDTILPLGLGAGFVGHLSDTVELLLEYSAIVNAGPGLELIDLPIYLVGYGARFNFGRQWALDVTLLRPMQEDSVLRTGEVELFRFLGVPFLAVTVRLWP
jgi:hypothetical protein